MTFDSVRIYTKPNCSYCVKAKQLLDMANIDYTEYRLDEHFTRDQLVSLYPTAKTYPVVVVDGWYLGGADDLAVHLEEHFNNKEHGNLITES